LNPEQKKAVTHGDGPLLIIAGAGTGKTTVVTERIKHLISSSKAHPQEILALTFTGKASREMEERVDMSLPYGVTQMWISTFHAFCDRVLRNEAVNIGLDSGFKLMTEAETILFFRKNLFRFELTYFRPLGNPTKFIGDMLQHFNRLRDEDISPSQYIDWVKAQSALRQSSGQAKLKFQKEKAVREEEKDKYHELASAYRTYEELKVKEGVMDYADLISQTLKLFRSRRTVLKRYQEQFKYLLIDEFQDTNFAQNELAILLAGPRKNITVVGDDDQAIYRWRGAAISNIIQFRTRFPDAKIIVLTKNYRSTHEILVRAYDLIQHNNPDRLEVKEKIEKKLECMRRKRGSQVETLFVDRVENETDEVAKQIKNVKGKRKNEKGEEQEYEWKDFAILVRANSHAEPFTRALSRRGIPYQFLGPGQLFRQPEVKDLIAYLKVLANFEDNVAMYRVLVADWLNISARDVASLIIFTRKFGRSLFESCELVSHGPPTEGEKRKQIEMPVVSKDTEEKVQRLVHTLHRHLGLVKKETAGQILYYFLQDTGLLEKLTQYTSVKDERAAANIAKFFDKLKTYEVDHDDASVYAVVDWIDLSMNLGESPIASDTDWSENNAVNILTIHSAKGLEFPIVFIVNLVSGRFPSNERSERIPIPDALVKEILPSGDYHEQEERRLFYVGMTRARDRLYLTGARYYGEGKRERKISPFVSDAIGREAAQLMELHPAQKNQQLALLEWERTPEVQAKPLTRRPVPYLSYSQLATFTTCPLQYKYRYILRIPVPPSAALTFGSTIHRTVKAFYERVKKGDHPTKQDLLSLLEEEWSSVGFGDKVYEEKMKRQGKLLISGFFEKGFDSTRIPKDLEQSFKIKITPQVTLVGKIDRVDEFPDGSIEIIDYKTGHAPKVRDVTKDPQLTVYALAATDPGLYDKPPDRVTLSFYFFEGQEKISAKRSKEQLVKARESIAAKAAEIAGSDFSPTPGKHCDFCEFRLICEAWN
jgi:DNA helicase-2/ATP-dependent DNA helicase PcrA